MTIDRYVPCPGGTGKKIKFCCADLFAELDHIHKMLQGQQRLACLEYVRKARATHPDRACLLAFQCLLESELEQTESLRQTLAAFQQKCPGNPVMLAELSLDRAETVGAREGIEPLQRAIEAIGDEMPNRVFVVLGILGRLLLSDGYFIAARAHLLLHAAHGAISSDEDSASISLLMRMNRTADVPLLMKQDTPLEAPPDDLPQRAEFERALALAHRGAWLAAATAIEATAQQQPSLPAVWHNLALLRGYLADHRGAATALRRLSTLDIPWDDAVEAEALAQLLDEQQPEDLVDVVVVDYPIEDVSVTQSRLTADRRVWLLSVDLSSMGSADQPPPLSAFRLLDRALPQSGTGLSPHDAPRVLAEVFLFGKQTDRPARLELVVSRGANWDAAMAHLADVLGQPLGAPIDEEVVRRVPALQHALGWRWYLPDDTPPQQRSEMERQRRRQTILQEWPALSNPALKGKSPRDAAADPAERTALAAAVLNLEQAVAGTSPEDAELFASLRSQLALPLPEPIEPSEVDVRSLPAVRLARLQVEALSDDDLVEGYRIAAWLHISRALVRLAAEVVRRPSLDQKVDKAEAFGLLAQLTDDHAQQSQYIDQARRAAEAAGESSAPWDLAEMAACAERGDAAGFERLFAHVRKEHWKEPGISEAVLNLLHRLGLVSVDSQGRVAPKVRPEAASSIIVPGEQAAPAGELWTPESAAQGSGPQKSVIWTPGNP